MTEYVGAAIVVVCLAVGIVFIVRLLSQQHKQLTDLQHTTDQRLSALLLENERNIQAISGLRQAFHDVGQEMAKAAREPVKSIQPAIEKLSTSADALAQISSKLDTISSRLSETGKADFPVSKTGTKTTIFPYFDITVPTIPSQQGIGKHFQYSTPVIPIEPEPLPFGVPGFPTTAVPFDPGILSTGTKPQITITPVIHTKTGGVHIYGRGTATTQPSAQPRNKRIVDLLYATTRAYSDALETFTGERNNNQITFGQALVRVPEKHLIGGIERPIDYTLLGFTIYREKEDPQKHFVIRGNAILSKEQWVKILSEMPKNDALVFVHGFHNTFDDALYRNAQIIWDLKFQGIAVLFSWPSRGRVADYLYDKESALGARKPFIEILELLTAQLNIERVHILAHSMGNLVVLDALGNYQAKATRLNLGELMMAAPDLDRDHYSSIAADARKLTSGMTLYASAADKALALSKRLAGDVPRAGDVPANGPIILPDIDSIDATYIGDEIFGLNHSTFAESRSILNDVSLLLGGMRPPDKRLAEILGIPDGIIPPKYWQYAAGPTSRV